MQATTINIIESEIAVLEGRLSASPDYQRLRKLKQLRDMGSAFQAAFTEAFGEQPDCEARSPHPENPTKEDGPEDEMQTTPTAVLINTSIKLMEERGKPVPFADLYGYLVREGFNIGGIDPRANLSSKLSASKEVYNAKPFGWWLESRRSEFAGKRKNPASANGVARLS